jgi:hypothetical protein
MDGLALGCPEPRWSATATGRRNGRDRGKRARIFGIFGAASATGRRTARPTCARGRRGNSGGKLERDHFFLALSAAACKLFLSRRAVCLGGWATPGRPRRDTPFLPCVASRLTHLLCMSGRLRWRGPTTDPPAGRSLPLFRRPGNRRALAGPVCVLPCTAGTRRASREAAGGADPTRRTGTARQRRPSPGNAPRR